MSVLLIAAASCASLSLGDMEPKATRFTFRQGDTPRSAGGAYFVQVIDAASPGEALVRTGLGAAAAPQQRVAPPAR